MDTSPSMSICLSTWTLVPNLYLLLGLNSSNNFHSIWTNLYYLFSYWLWAFVIEYVIITCIIFNMKLRYWMSLLHALFLTWSFVIEYVIITCIIFNMKLRYWMSLLHVLFLTWRFVIEYVIITCIIFNMKLRYWICHYYMHYF